MGVYCSITVRAGSGTGCDSTGEFESVRGTEFFFSSFSLLPLRGTAINQSKWCNYV